MKHERQGRRDLLNGEPGAQATIRMHSAKRALLASGGARLAVLPLTAVSNLINARLITDAVGIDLFGAVMVIATLSQVLTFADLGAGAAVATASARLDGTVAPADRFRRILLTALRTMLASTAGLALIAVVVGALGQWAYLLGIKVPDIGGLSANAATVVALLAFGAALPFALGEAVLRGSGRLHEAVLLVGLSAPAALVITIGLYMMNAPAFAYALSIPLGASLATVGCAIRGGRAARAAVGPFIGQIFKPQRFPGSPIAATAAPWFVVMIGLPIALQSDKIVLAHRVDAASLSDYSYAAQIYTPMWSVVSVAGLALWPMFAAAKNRHNDSRRNWVTGVGILGSAGVVFAIAFLALGGVIIGWMSGGAATPEFPLLLSFAILLVVQSLHITSGIMLISPRQLTFQAVCVTALVLANVPLSWVLAPVLGPAGPVFASAVTVGICQLIPCSVLAYRATAAGSADTSDDADGADDAVRAK